MNGQKVVTDMGCLGNFSHFSSFGEPVGRCIKKGTLLIFLFWVGLDLHWYFHLCLDYPGSEKSRGIVKVKVRDRNGGVVREQTDR